MSVKRQIKSFSPIRWKAGSVWHFYMQPGICVRPSFLFHSPARWKQGLIMWLYSIYVVSNSETQNPDPPITWRLYLIQHGRLYRIVTKNPVFLRESGIQFNFLTAIHKCQTDHACPSRYAVKIMFRPTCWSLSLIKFNIIVFN